MFRNSIIFIILLLSGLFFARSSHAGIVLLPTNYLSIRSGLVGYWSFSEGVGNMAYDKSGNTNNGTLTNGPTWVNGATPDKGKALDFDGTNDFVLLTNTESLNITSNISMSAWVKTSASGNFVYLIVGGYNPGSPFQGYGWGPNADGKQVYWSSVTGSWTGNLGTAVNDGKWHHVAISVDNTIVKTYLDGSLDATFTSNKPGSFSDKRGIGALSNAVNSFDGSIDEVRIYSRALSADEIRRLYNMSVSKYNVSNKTGSLQTNLVGYWSFDGSHLSKTTAEDQSGKRNHGTLTNNPLPVKGRIGQALSFDGVDDYVDVDGVVSSISGSTNGTISFWAKFNIIENLGTGTNRGLFVTFDNSGGNGDISMLQTGLAGADNFGFRYRVSGGNSVGANTTDTTLFSNGAWRNWVGVWTAGNIYFYIDGELKDSATKSGTESGIDNAAIGSNGGGSSSFFDGSIDEVRVYNRALSADEVRRLYNMGVSKYNVSPKTGSLWDGLVQYWSFDGSHLSKTTAEDQSGNGNHGTLVKPPQPDTGKIGQALNFSSGASVATHSYVLNDTGPVSDYPVTICAWFNSRDTSTKQAIAFVGIDGSAGGAAKSIIGIFAYGTLSGDPIVADDISSIAIEGKAQSTTSYKTGQWYHACGVFISGSNRQIYVNGKFEGSDTTNTNALSTAPQRAEAGDCNQGLAGGTCGFDGLIDEVRIYNRALNADEMRRLYNMGR